MNTKILIPYPSQQANDDLASALSLLRVTLEAMEQRRAMHDHMVVICDAVRLMEPVLDLLNREDVPSFEKEYRECRIARITKHQGGAS